MASKYVLLRTRWVLCRLAFFTHLLLAVDARMKWPCMSRTGEHPG